jgi:hypothetical protein
MQVSHASIAGFIEVTQENLNRSDPVPATFMLPIIPSFPHVPGEPATLTVTCLEKRDFRPRCFR